MGRRENLGGYKGNIPNFLGRAWFVLAGLVPCIYSIYNPGYFPCIYCI